MRRYGSMRVEGVLFTGPNKLTLATNGKQGFEDRKVRIPAGDNALRADLHKLQKITGPTGTPRFVADSDSAGHADRTWALFLAQNAASNGGVDIEFQSTGERDIFRVLSGFGDSSSAGELTDTGFGTVRGINDFGGFL